MKCQYCQGPCMKKGCHKRQQLYQCKNCLKYQRVSYTRMRVSEDKKEMVSAFVIEGLSISSMSRLLKIAKSTILRIIKEKASEVKKTVIEENHHQYEIDELRTYIAKKENACWIIYAMNKVTKQVVDFVVGKRTIRNIKQLTDLVLRLNPERIFTDKLNIYPGLIPKSKHIASAYRINHIERKNLDLRKDLKCLNRKTICYSKSEEMLTAKLKIYFWK